MKYNIFLLDADQTIFDFKSACKQALITTLKAFNIKFKKEYFEIYYKINDDLWKKLEKKEITKKQLLFFRFDLFLKRIDKKGDIDKINEEYINNIESFSDYLQGAEDFLKRLKEQGKIYLITNGTASIQRRRIAKLNCQKYFDGIFISDEIGFAKPDKRFFDYVISHIKDFDKDRAVVIGDSLSSDILGANNSNLTSIWYNAENFSLTISKPDYIAENYEEILNLIK